jgi:hypothetical protein
MESLISQMAVIANEVGIPSYVGDLLHDASSILNAEQDDTFYWVFKDNGCGTWMANKDSPFLAYYLQQSKRVYEVQVLETGTGYEYPKGTVTKKEYKLETPDGDSYPTVTIL